MALIPNLRRVLSELFLLIDIPCANLHKNKNASVNGEIEGSRTIYRASIATVLH